ncbi:hypothetical protein Tsubulata_026618, partial [Turnera subulata]
MASNGVAEKFVGGIETISPPFPTEIEDLARFAVETQKEEWLHKKEALVFKRLLLGAFGSLGAPEDIPDAATNLEVIELARFAVNEHNKQEKTNLEFKGVVKASEQVVAGYLYRIVLKAAKPGDVSRFYEAKVLLPAGVHVKVLLDFKPLLQTAKQLGAISGQAVDIPLPPFNEKIIHLAQFAVDQHSKKEGKHLEFKKVLSAKSKVVAGTNYVINLVAGEDGQDSEYKATVWVKEWDNFKRLTSFDRIHSRGNT